VSDTNPIRHLYQLVQRETVTVFVRVVAGILAVSMGLLGYGPSFESDSDAYQNPVFDGVFSFASPFAWGLWFFAGASLLLLTAITGRAVIYVIGAVVAGTSLAAWSSIIMATAALSEEAVLTQGAIGLYVGTFTALIGLPLSPRQLAVEKPIVAVAPESGEVTSLRRIG
jgi:hypothetical protein